MLAVLLTVHLIACLALVIAVMLQRSEGGALGMGGGGTGGLISGRGAASALVRTTMVLAAIFFATSITMTAVNSYGQKNASSFEKKIQQDNSKPIDPLSAPGSGPGGLKTPLTTPAPATPAPAPTPDPLSPNLGTSPAGSATPTPAPATPPAATAPTTPKPATPAPAAPKTPAPATPPQNGGSNTP